MATMVLAPNDLSVVRNAYPLNPVGRYGFTANGFPVHRCSWLPNDVVGICTITEGSTPEIRWFKIEQPDA